VIHKEIKHLLGQIHKLNSVLTAIYLVPALPTESLRHFPPKRRDTALHQTGFAVIAYFYARSVIAYQFRYSADKANKNQ